MLLTLEQQRSTLRWREIERILMCSTRAHMLDELTMCIGHCSLYYTFKTSNLISRLFIIIFDYNIQNIIIFDSTMITRRLDCQS